MERNLTLAISTTSTRLGVDQTSFLKEQGGQFHSSQLDQLAAKINDLLTAFSSLVSNSTFNEIASLDERISNFFSDQGDLNHIIQDLYVYHSWALGFSTVLYSLEMGDLLQGTSEREAKRTVLQETKTILGKIEKYLSMFSSLKSNSFYLTEIHYRETHSDCLKTNDCLFKADLDLSEKISTLKDFCIQMIK